MNTLWLRRLWAITWLLGLELRTSARLCSLLPRSLWFRSLWPKILFFITCKYTVDVFRYTRESQISLRMVVSHHVVAGIWTQDLQKSSQCSSPMSHLSSPWGFFSIVVLGFTTMKQSGKNLNGLDILHKKSNIAELSVRFFFCEVCILLFVCLWDRVQQSFFIPLPYPPGWCWDYTHAAPLYI